MTATSDAVLTSLCPSLPQVAEKIPSPPDASYYRDLISHMGKHVLWCYFQHKELITEQQVASSHQAESLRLAEVFYSLVLTAVQVA